MNAGRSSGGKSSAGGRSATSTSGSASKGKSAVSSGRASTGAAASNSKARSVNDDVSLSKETKEKDARSGVNLAAWDDSKAVDGAAKTDEAVKDGATDAKAADADLSAALGDKSLKSGMHNESVRSLQSALNDKLGIELGTDGKFGAKTKAAVKDFQRQNGLKPDGIVGPKTRAKLVGGGAPEAKDGKLPTGEDIPVPTARPDRPEDKAAGKLPTGEDIPVPTARPDRPEEAAAQEQKGKVTEMSFGQKLSDGQKKAVNQMVDDLKAKGYDVKADDIVNFMAVETAGTFSPSIRAGGKKNGAVGLAQFTGIAIKQMNKFRGKNDQLTKGKLSKMSFEEQSKVVTEYLTGALGSKMKGKSVSAADLYTAVFAPAHVGKAPSATIYSKSRNRTYYNANRSLDTNRDGRISKSELTARLNDWVARGAQLRG